MADILHDFPIRAPAERVFDAMSRPPGLDQWWTLRSAGEPAPGAEYELNFGPGYDWRARVTRCTHPKELEWDLLRADADWEGTRVGFLLEERGETTWVRFAHTGWREANEHYRISSLCWAMYLRILRRWVEHGESVPYATRLDV